MRAGTVCSWCGVPACQSMPFDTELSRERTDMRFHDMAAPALGAAHVLLAGCIITPIDQAREPPHGWPELSVRVEHVAGQLNSVCHLRSGVFAPLVGCTVIDFARRSCVIYLGVRSETVLQHELLHCHGYDHPDESTFRDAWDSFNRRSWQVRAP
jgi:hypothetical protein